MPGIGRVLIRGVYKDRLLCLATRRFCLVSLLLSAVPVLAWLVAQPTACQDDNQQCWHPKADEDGQVHARLAHGEKEWYPNKLWGIDAGMQQGSDENAPLGVVEDPRKDDCKCYDHQKKNGEVCEEGSEAGAWPSPVIRRQEVQQMPEAPQDTQEQGTPQWPIARLHAGQREAAPADLLGHRNPKEDHDKVHRITHQYDGGKTLKAGKHSWLDNDSKQKQCWDAYEDEQIPLPAGAPLLKGVPQATQACFPFGDAGHDEGSQGRSYPRLQDERDCVITWQNAPNREHVGNRNDPGERVRHEKEEEQGMLSHHLSQASGSSY